MSDFSSAREEEFLEEVLLTMALLDAFMKRFSSMHPAPTVFQPTDKALTATRSWLQSLERNCRRNLKR